MHLKLKTRFCQQKQPEMLWRHKLGRHERQLFNVTITITTITTIPIMVVIVIIVIFIVIKGGLSQQTAGACPMSCMSRE